jgi:hypothetical protein
MSFIARWQSDARFWHRQTVIDLIRKWEREIGTKAATDTMDFKILTGSIGAREATVDVDHTIESLAELERFFETFGKIDSHKQLSKDPRALCGLRHCALEHLSGRLTRVRRPAIRRAKHQCGATAAWRARSASMRRALFLNAVN